MALRIETGGKVSSVGCGRIQDQKNSKEKHVGFVLGAGRVKIGNQINLVHLREDEKLGWEGKKSRWTKVA